MSVFADTSFFIAVTDKDDRHHSNAEAWKAWLKARHEQLVLHAGILMELGDGFARLYRRDIGRRLIEALLTAPDATCVPVSDELLAEGCRLYVRRKDKEWGLTDCTSFVLMKKLRISKALTVDPHFEQAGFDPVLLKPPPF